MYLPKSTGSLRTGERPEYTGASMIWDLCPRPVDPREQVKNHGRACTQSTEGPVLSPRKGLYSVLFLRKAELGIFSLFKNSDKLAGTFHWSGYPSTASSYFPPQKIPLAENRFLQVGNGSWKCKGENPGSALRLNEYWQKPNPDNFAV
jgi:hypothetical protein